MRWQRWTKKKDETMVARELNVVYEVTKGLKMLDAATVNDARTCKKKVKVTLILYSENVFIKYKYLHIIVHRHVGYSLYHIPRDCERW